jgi:hypothetical protein
MGNLGILILALLSLLGAAFAKLLADEFKAWAPSIVSSILAVAVAALPPSQRDRAGEEWDSHVNELPGDLSKFMFACGCVLAAWKIDGWPFRIGKRALEIAMSLSAIALLTPMLLMTAVALKVTSRGPVFFVQHRVGLRGKRFKIFKFRTLEIDGKNAQPTKVGSILRATRIDDLPQTFNVLKGDMSMVGPRPLPETKEGDLLAEQPGIMPQKLSSLFAADIRALGTTIAQFCKRFL